MTTALLDVSRLLNRLVGGKLPTGVDRVGLEYIRHYGTDTGTRAVLSEAGICAVLSASQSERAFDLLLQQDPASTFAARKIIAQAAYRALRNDNFPGSILFHTSHSGIERNRYMRAMKQRGVRTVVMVHDLIPLTHAEYCRPTIDRVHRQRMHSALRHASGIIANSQATLDSLVDEAHAAQLPMPPAVVAHLAPGIEPMARLRRPINAPYFVMLGTIEPRKNHWLMLHVWRRLVENLGNAAPTLVLVGRRGWECENVIDMLERSAPLKRAVIEEADCNDARLQAWLQHAQALVFPSFVEGYGMPLAEALAQGVPVIASDLEVFKEIANNIPEYLDPLDGPGWLAMIRAYADPSNGARNAQIERLRHFCSPTWKRHFEIVDRFVGELR
ncbi:glycosyltransferase family 4 protein [Paraburkholderia denitrificans]|uniref:Glycosyltransferase family 4 protein n=1 Tax=Paraburkholderia denitrificans TaxID=694025 RepID=A0ABW0JB18_9BURK